MVGEINMTEHEKKILKQLKRKLKDFALGWESSLDFSLGYITALQQNKLITSKFATELKENFVNYKFDDNIDKIEKKYGRLLGA